MERITTLMTAAGTVNDLTLAMDRLDATQQRLASGKRINQPSDDPYGASLAIQLNGSISGLGAYSRNVDDGTAWVQASDAALSGINNITQRVRELVVQNANDSYSQSDRNAAADEIDQLTDAIKQAANATDAGQYIFSGTATTTQPYQPGATDTYAGNSGTISREIAPGTTVPINTDISQLLGNGQAANDGKLLDVLRNISSDLRGGTTANATALRTTDLQGLDTNLSTLTQMQANVGATETRLQLASSRIQDLQLSQQSLLSTTQDADMAQTAIDYSTQQASFNAALRASANIVQSSLLDFLK